MHYMILEFQIKDENFWIRAAYKGERVAARWKGKQEFRGISPSAGVTATNKEKWCKYLLRPVKLTVVLKLFRESVHRRGSLCFPS